MKRKRRALTRVISDATELPENVFPGVCDINIIQNSEISIENCRGILVYEADRICLKMARFTLCITGEELTLKSYFGSHISVRGTIRSLVFNEDEI